VGLPAFLLSKNVCSESIGTFRLHRNMSGGAYLDAFQLSFWLKKTARKEKTRRRAPGTEPILTRLFARSSTKCYPVLVRRLTIGSDWFTADPTVNPLISPATLGSHRTEGQYTGKTGFVKPPCQKSLGAPVAFCAKADQALIRLWAGPKTRHYRVKATARWRRTRELGRHGRWWVRRGGGR